MMFVAAQMMKVLFKTEHMFEGEYAGSDALGARDFV